MELFAEDVVANITSVVGREGDVPTQAQDDDGCLYKVIGVARQGDGPVLLAITHDSLICPNH